MSMFGAVEERMFDQMVDKLNAKVRRIYDRSAIQKKTFTKWINTYLIKVGQAVDDLYGDLSDGNKLITLLEILTGDRLPRERGKMRFHKLQNVETSLDLLKRKKIRLVNIRNDDIVDGNPKLILGLIWTIILNFEISHDPEGQASAKANLIDWAKRATRGYKGVDVKNFTSSFKNGMAFNAIIHRFRPDIIDYERLKPENAEENLENAFSVAEEELGIPRLLDVEDFILDELDEKSIMTYLSAFNRMYSKVPTEEELAVKVYSDRINVDAKKIMNWLKSNIDRLEKKIYKMDPEMFEKYKADLQKLEEEEMPEKRELKEYLGDCYKNIKLAEAEDMITTDITMDKIEKFWDMLETSLAEKRAAVQAEKDRINAQNELADRIQHKAEQAAEKLDQIKQMILQPPEGADLAALIQDAKQLLYNSNMEEDTRAMYSGVSALTKENHPRAEELSKEVQLISDELDEIKVRLDTLHEDLEQGAIDKIDNRINELLEQIRAKNDQLKDDGYGDNLPSALRILDNLLTLMDEVDYLEPDIAAVKAAVAENPRSDLKQDAKDLDYQYGQLKSNCVSKDQDMREGVEFLEAIAELLKWGREQKDREMRFDWSDYHPLDHPYEKSLVQGIGKQQKKFDQILGLGKQLLKTEHPMSRAIGEEVEELCELWTCLKDLACVAEKHIQHHNDHELFWKRLNNANMWITQKRNLLDTRYNAKCLDVVSSSERLQELVDMKKDIIGYDPNIVEIANLGKVVVNLSKRKKPKSGDKVLALCPFKRPGPTGNIDHRNDIVSRGEECQYLGSTGLDVWRIKKGLPPPAPVKINGHGEHPPNSNGPGTYSSGLVTEVPSCIFTTLPPDEECVNESDKTNSEYQKLKITYDRQRGYLKHLMVKHEFFSNCDVVLTWPYDKNFEAELRGRELVISNLQEAGAGLISEADNHPNSDKIDIIERQNKALDHWDFLLSKHKQKTSAVVDLEKKIENLDQDVKDLEGRFEVVVVTPDSVAGAEKSLDKMLKDILAMVNYCDELEDKIDEESDVSCSEDFQPLINKLNRVKTNLNKVQKTCEDKARSVGRLLTLQDLVQTVTVTLENVSDTLADMHLYPLDVEVVVEDVKKLQLISEDLVSEDDNISEIESIRDELSDLLREDPLLVEIQEMLERRDLISAEIDQRSKVLSGESEPGIAQYESAVARSLHWLEDAEDKLKKEELQPSFKERYQLLAALNSDVTLKVCLFEDLKAAQQLVVSSSDAYEVLLVNYQEKFPISSPSKGHGERTAKSLAQKEGDAVQEQYLRIKADVSRLLVILRTDRTFFPAEFSSRDIRHGTNVSSVSRLLNLANHADCPADISRATDYHN